MCAPLCDVVLFWRVVASTGLLSLTGYVFVFWAVSDKYPSNTVLAGINFLKTTINKKQQRLSPTPPHDKQLIGGGGGGGNGMFVPPPPHTHTHF